MTPAGVYATYIDRIASLAPSAKVLRWPSHAGGDVDIQLDATDYYAVRGFLIQSGFIEEYSWQPFRHIWRKRHVARPRPITVDIYLEEKWGLGYMLRKLDDKVPSEALRRMMRAVYEKRDKGYFSREYPDLWPSELFKLEGCAARWIDWLWEAGHVRILGWMLVGMGRVTVSLATAGEVVWRRLQFRLDQVRRRRGLEVAVVGVDGAGKTTLVERMRRELPLPTVSIYMGTGEFKLPIGRWADRSSIIWRTFAFVGRHWELALRRLTGRIAARRGHVVVYDRHPAEGLRFDEEATTDLRNLLAGCYTGPVDEVIRLKGDLEEFDERKSEHGVSFLRQLDRHLTNVLNETAEPQRRIDTTRMGRDQTFRVAGQRLIRSYQDRIRVRT